ncbi:ATP-dependent endonuclease [Nitrosomonas sp.]|uniref:ATP-dependent nuclease n=1 Tax=Nitrosomonas sp. TaxID=42353 RepID=UPI00271CF44A|nr:ATP-binding protein [Nitrosomonas sp.]MDO8894762.1 ATP-binding protein [Nitrosomonas sp.]
MKYRESQRDKELRKRFENDNAHLLLRQIVLKEGTLRGLDALNIKFQYPVTAIAGKNGAGKSTILALACCAYHNSKTGFKLPKRKNTYYTFSDFFIQHAEEIPPEGIEIEYYIAHNKWKKTQKLPEGIGIGIQRRRKNKGGKWNDYADRVRKNVVFLGIERIVPHSERSQSRSYSRVFSSAVPKGWEDKAQEAVGFVLGRTYNSFRYLEHSKYSLPIVQVGDTIYSGFNMGAGENALFEIFSIIYSCGAGSLLVLDEIELGLHAEAQRRFIERLKDVCYETHTQVICTTHSREIFDCLPYDARFFIEKVNGKSKITEGISSDFAFSKLAAVPSAEVELLVEDEVAKAILLTSLPTTIRSRIAINVIGSATALARQLAAIYVRGEERPTLAIFDGDQRPKQDDNLKHAKNMCEKCIDSFSEWFNSRIDYLPGETWPEAWLIQQATECTAELALAVSCDSDTLKDVLEYGLQAGKHNEFYEIAKQLGIERDMCLQAVAMVVTGKFKQKFEPLISHITEVLKNAG